MSVRPALVAAAHFGDIRMRGCKRSSNQIARHRRRATSLKDVRYAKCRAARNRTDFSGEECVTAMMTDLRRKPNGRLLRVPGILLLTVVLSCIPSASDLCDDGSDTSLVDLFTFSCTAASTVPAQNPGESDTEYNLRVSQYQEQTRALCIYWYFELEKCFEENNYPF